MSEPDAPSRTGEPEEADASAEVAMAVLIARHLYLFVSGKMEVAGLGEFCCSSRPLHENAARSAREREAAMDGGDDRCRS